MDIKIPGHQLRQSDDQDSILLLRWVCTADFSVRAYRITCFTSRASKPCIWGDSPCSPTSRTYKCNYSHN